MDGKRTIGQRIKQSRGFLFALAAVTIVWFATAMSERKTYRESYRVTFDGIDTARYVVTQCDSTVLFNITSNGFHAFSRGLRSKRPLRVDIHSLIAGDDSSKIAVDLRVEDWMDVFRDQLDTRGVSSMQALSQQLSLRLSRREQKAFAPRIGNVDFIFEDMVGLCGSPRVEPDSVYLYGSRESLDKIDSVVAAPQTLRHIRHSGSHTVSLREDWKKYPDIRCSHTSVSVYVPAEQFIEKIIEIPVSFSACDDIKKVNLYPATVQVTALVPLKEYSKVNAGDFEVSVSMVCDSARFLEPVVRRFPANTRVKSVKPTQIQYIVIR